MTNETKQIKRGSIEARRDCSQTMSRHNKVKVLLTALRQIHTDSIKTGKQSIVESGYRNTETQVVILIVKRRTQRLGSSCRNLI